MQIQEVESTLPTQPAPTLLFATTGISWPAPLADAGQIQQLGAEAIERCVGSNSLQPIWLGYGNPGQLLLNAELDDPNTILDRWCNEARWLLQIRQACLGHCQLLNLPLVTTAAAAAVLGRATNPASTADHGAADREADREVAYPDPRLAVLAMQHPELQNLYADLEGCADLHGRTPEFSLGLLPLRSQAFSDRCLASWREEKIASQSHEQSLLQAADQLRSAAEGHASELSEAREEAELTLLQLHQVQEELEHYFLEHRKASSAAEHHASELSEAREETEQIRRDHRQVCSERDQLALDVDQLRSAAEHHASELSEAREEAELTLLQLHQVQEELEHYFLEHRKASEELDQQRSKLVALQHEARLLFIHSRPMAGLNRSNLSEIHQLMRQCLELTQA